MDLTEINSSGMRGELFFRIDRQNYRFRTAKTIKINFGLHASFVELESDKNAVNEGIMKPFTEVIRADINDIQAMGQKPITFIRQVLTSCTYPVLLNDPSLPSDVKVRANEILDECGGRSAAAYTYSEGIDLIRLHVAQYLEKRDGFPARQDDVILSSGSLEALRSILNVLNLPQSEIPIGILVPVPRDPAYSALLDELGMMQIDYYLEEDYWSIKSEELSIALETASRYCIPKAIIVINPGSPTGSILTPRNMEEIVKFAARRESWYYWQMR
ncbi:alanine aminotransferase 1 [Trichonephila clavipes]|nr:alanine aminotransferase 1 [Trichonephila clavipes]